MSLAQENVEKTAGEAGRTRSTRSLLAFTLRKLGKNQTLYLQLWRLTKRHKAPSTTCHASDTSNKFSKQVGSLCSSNKRARTTECSIVLQSDPGRPIVSHICAKLRSIGPAAAGAMDESRPWVKKGFRHLWYQQTEALFTMGFDRIKSQPSAVEHPLLNKIARALLVHVVVVVTNGQETGV